MREAKDRIMSVLDTKVNNLFALLLDFICLLFYSVSLLLALSSTAKLHHNFTRALHPELRLWMQSCFRLRCYGNILYERCTRVNAL